MNNTTLELEHQGWDYKLILTDDDQQHVIKILDEADASHYISANVCLYSMTGVTKPGDELMLSSDVVCADEQDEFFFRGQDWRLLKRYNLTDKALELVEDWCEERRNN